MGQAAEILSKGESLIVQILSEPTEIQAIVRNYLENTSAYYSGFHIMLAFALFCFCASSITGNGSYTDRLWSITPIVYIWHFAFTHYLQNGVWSPRLVAMGVLITCWGIRLTSNFWRKGGYKKGEEDYRWPFIRQYINDSLYVVFNIVFISFYQHYLLYLLVCPAFLISTLEASVPGKYIPLSIYDYGCIIAFVSLLTIETIADQQQWDFYARREMYRKKRGQSMSRDSSRANTPAPPSDEEIGFNRSGLFRYSRHPNFIAEQSIWWVVYLFSVSATVSAKNGVWDNHFINSTVSGAIQLTMLFQGSTFLTELITTQKYPAYEAYARKTARFLPIPWPFPAFVFKGNTKYL